MTVSEALYLAADTMDVWVPPMVMALAGLIIGCLHLMLGVYGER